MNTRDSFDLFSISFRITQVILGIFFQLITSNIAFSQESNKLQTLIDGHMLVRGSSSIQSAQKYGKSVFLETSKFIQDPRHTDLLNSPKGRDLLKHQSFLHNYFTIKNHFEKCVKSPNNRRNLPTRILNAAGKASYIDLPCNPNISKQTSIEDLHKNMKQVVNLKMKSLFQDDLYLETMQNSLKTYIALRYRYEKDFMIQGNESAIRKNAARIVKGICKKNRGKVCPSYAQKALVPIVIEELKNVVGTKKQSYAAAAGDINKKLAKINKKLEQIPLVAEGGYFKTPVWDTSDADFKNIETQDKFNDYVGTYLHEASYGDGLLLHTDHMKDEAGKLRRLDDSDLDEDTNYLNPTNFTFEKHRPITGKDARKAKKEAQKQMKKQMHMLGKMANTKEKQIEKAKRKAGGRGNKKVILKNRSLDKSRMKDIRKLVKTNPAAVGTLLMKKPHYLEIVCDAINSISVEDVTDENWDKAFLWGGIIVGGVLTVTGIGSGVGAIILSSSSAIAALGTAATVSSVTAAAIGAGELGYWGKRSYQHYDDMKNFERAYITGNSDFESIREAKESLDKFKRALFHSALALGLTFRGLSGIEMVSTAGAKVGGLAGKASWVMGRQQLAALTVVLDTISNSFLAKIFIKVLKYLGPTGQTKLNAFFIYLAGTSADLRDKFFNKVKSEELAPDQIAKIMDETLDLATQNCKDSSSCNTFSVTLQKKLEDDKNADASGQ